jgi:hypothetical protein
LTFSAYAILLSYCMFLGCFGAISGVLRACKRRKFSWGPGILPMLIYRNCSVSGKQKSHHLRLCGNGGFSLRIMKLSH